MHEGHINHLYYKIIGEGEPLLLVSGLGADHQAWLPLVGSLSKQFKCILFDNRGIGKSSIPDDGECTIEKMSDDVAMLLKGLGVEKISLIGHSLGGYIAQNFASVYPKLISKLILISTKAKSQATQTLYQETTIKMMEQNIQRELIIQNTICWLFSSNYLSRPQNIINILNVSMQKPLDETRQSYFYQVTSTLNFDTSGYASKISAPALIITGDQDMLVTLQDAKHLNQLIKNSRLDILENMGHMAHVEIPDVLGMKVVQFIAS